MTGIDATSMRTDLCGRLGTEDAGRTVAVCGWVDRRREHSEHLAFVDLRDHSGVLQCVVDGARELRSEYVVRITGTVRLRPEGTANPALGTGEVELHDCEVELLSRAEPPPFPLDERTEVDEILRLRHRYVDLRKARHAAQPAGPGRGQPGHPPIHDAQGFVEVETPMLIASTPEGPATSWSRPARSPARSTPCPRAHRSSSS